MQAKMLVRCLCYAAYGGVMYAFDRVQAQWQLVQESAGETTESSTEIH